MVSVKMLDIRDTEYNSAQDYAEHTPGIYMNMLNGIRWDPITNLYKAAPVKYSDTPLEGEKIKFASGQEFTVIFSCLATEYANKTEVREAWNKAAQKLKEDYLNQEKIERHIATNNTDLKKLQKEGALSTKEELDKE